jgi:glycyl-tRNA synthetase beta chain
VTARRKHDKGTSPRTLPFLLEVGCEEIPARFLRDAERDLGERLLAGLREDRLLPEAGAGCEPPLPSHPGNRGPVPELPIRTYSTPRRLVVHIPALLARQPDKVEEILGPPVKVAVDPAGKYTRAAESFAQKNSARLEDLIGVGTPKGEYLALRRTTQGRSAQDVLGRRLHVLLWNLNFPKSMYWEQTEGAKFRFVRPIRWLLALLGEGENARVVPFEIPGNVSAGSYTFGHRTKGTKPLLVSGFKSYMKKLEQAYVEIDPGARRKRVIEETQEAAKKAGLKLVQDDWLVDWVVNSTEWPRAMLGNFDERFLHLPREILITVMRDHQKYFAVEDGQGNLRPHFVAVLNMGSDEKGLIRQGHERVLAARFRDAEFFWKADQRASLRDREPLLEKVTYQVELGSYANKVKRMLMIGDSIRAALEKQDSRVMAYTVAIGEAIRLCKCDLTTQMVQEFPELQGVVGGLYAAAQGEPKEIADAIYDHYLPQSTEDRCPRSLVGAVVSICDKLDGVVGGFAVGREPTGSSDPFALRRQGNGIIKVILEFKRPLDLYAIIRDTAKSLFPNEAQKRGDGLAGAVCGFLSERLRYYMETARGLRYDTVRAVLRTGLVAVPSTAVKCAEDLERVRKGEDFGPLAEAAKRIKNILWKSDTVVPGGPLLAVDDSILEDGAEKDLYQAYLWAKNEVKTFVDAQAFYDAFKAIAALRPVVARFFDEVLVMVDAPATRTNRLHLLQNLDNLFSSIAHLSEIVIGQGDVDASTSTTKTS